MVPYIENQHWKSMQYHRLQQVQHVSCTNIHSKMDRYKVTYSIELSKDTRKAPETVETVLQT